jgi:hypothetical protein
MFAALANSAVGGKVRFSERRFEMESLLILGDYQSNFMHTRAVTLKFREFFD